MGSFLRLRTPKAGSFVLITALLILALVPISIHAFSSGQKATTVIGQPNFTTASAPTPTATGIYDSYGVAFDTSGNLFVADYYNNRVLEFEPPFSNGSSASIAFGEPNLNTKLAKITNQSNLFLPSAVATNNAGDLWVADEGNDRVVEYVPPFSTHMLASLVLGQTNFNTDNYGSVTNRTLFSPVGVAFDPSGDLWVVDYDCRVLEFVPPFSNDMAASLAIGSTNLNTDGCGQPTSASSLGGPWGLAFDSNGNLWVGDDSDCRVLEFVPPFSTGMSASVVLGQSGFGTKTCATSQFGLLDAIGLAFDHSGVLWVADASNARVLGFMPPFNTGMAASFVIGQSSFTTGTSSLTQNGLGCPFGLAVDHSGNLWVGDDCYSRVLEYAGPSTTTTSVSCIPSSVAVGSSSECTATVSGGSGPTGLASWTANPPASVSFSSSTCTLTSGSCAVTVTGLSASTASITATYNGDPNDASSSGSFDLSVYSSIRESLADSVSFGDGSSQSIFQTIQKVLTDTLGIADSSANSIFQTIQKSLTDTVGMVDSSTNSILQTIHIALTDAIRALDGIKSTVTIPQLVFRLSSVSPANLFVSDPLGRRIGCNQGGTIVDQIPEGIVSGCGARSETVSIPGAVVGNYAVHILGTEASSTKGSHFTLIIKTLSLKGNPLFALTVTGKTTPIGGEQVLVSVLADGEILLTTITIGMTGITSLAGSAVAIAVLGRVRSRTMKTGSRRSQLFRKLAW